MMHLTAIFSRFFTTGAISIRASLILVGVIWLAGCVPVPDVSDTELVVTANKDYQIWSVGESLSHLELTGFDNQPLALSTFIEAQTPVILYYWASWHELSALQLPLLQQLSQEHANKVAVIGVHRTDTESIETGKEFAYAYGADTISLAQGSQELYLATGGIGMPVFVFIDNQGVITQIYYGYLEAEKLQEIINSI